MGFGRSVYRTEHPSSAALVSPEAAGIPRERLTLPFGVSRAVGWAADVLEQAADNEILRRATRRTWSWG